MKIKKSDKPLTKREIGKLEKNDLGWKLDAKHTKLTKVFNFEKHVDALIFIARMTVHAEVLKHYPDVHFTQHKAKVVLTSPEQKTLTKKDLALLSRIEKLHQKFATGDNS
tara:strand:+ start:814 stop:1143 length:330 start_codon:yes stop_codon:yes gene_type:complete